MSVGSIDIDPTTQIGLFLIVARRSLDWHCRWRTAASARRYEEVHQKLQLVRKLAFDRHNQLKIGRLETCRKGLFTTYLVVCRTDRLDKFWERYCFLVFESTFSISPTLKAHHYLGIIQIKWNFIWEDVYPRWIEWWSCWAWWRSYEGATSNDSSLCRHGEAWRDPNGSRRFGWSYWWKEGFHWGKRTLRRWWRREGREREP